MGRVDIPPLATAGRLRCDIELSAEELQQTVELLRTAVSLLPAARNGGPAPAPVSAPAPAVQAKFANGPPSYRPPTTTAPATPARATSSSVAAPVQNAAPRATSSYAASQLAHNPCAPGFDASSSTSGWQGAPAQAASEPSAAGAAPGAVNGSSMEWKRCWTTETVEHDRSPITALYYRQTFDGLFGGDGHAGWLVSASNRILNLWECSPSAGKGEPALQIMHQQATDFRPTSLDFDSPTQLLIAPSLDQRAGSENKRRVALFAMDSEGLPLRYRFAIQMPQQEGGATEAQRQPLPLLAASLSPLGGFLQKHMVMAHAKELAVLDLSTAGAGADPVFRVKWMTQQPVTCLATYAAHFALLSGNSQGNVEIWNFRAPPVKPAAICKKPGARLTTIAMVSEHILAGGALDGSVSLWDVRKPDALLGSLNLGAQVAGIASFQSANNCTVAVSTTAGVQVGTVVGSDIPIWQRVPVTAPPAKPAAAPGAGGQHPGVLTWNTRTQDLVYGSADGSVQVFREGQ